MPQNAGVSGERRKHSLIVIVGVAALVAAVVVFLYRDFAREAVVPED